MNSNTPRVILITDGSRATTRVATAGVARRIRVNAVSPGGWINWQSVEVAGGYAV